MQESIFRKYAPSKPFRFYFSDLALSMLMSGTFARRHGKAYFTPGGILWPKRSILSKRMRRKISKRNFSGICQWRKSRNHLNFSVAKNSALSFPPVKSKNDDNIHYALCFQYTLCAATS